MYARIMYDMNKKFLLVILTLLMVVAFAACGSKDAKQPTGETQAVTAPSVQTVPATEPAVTEVSVQTVPTEPAETELAETIPPTTEMDWSIGEEDFEENLEEDFGDAGTATTPVKPSETKPAVSDPVDDESGEAQWDMGEESFD